MNYNSIFYINNRFILGIILNSLFIALELFYGFQANSVSLIADAVHNAADVFGLCLIWFSYFMANREAPTHFTYGYKNATIFAAFLNTIVIFVAVGNLIWVSIERFVHTQIVVSKTMIIIASIGVLTNGLTALLFMKGRDTDINIRGVYLNMALDAAVSASVVVAGVFIYWKGWYWLDPMMSIVIAITILFSSWGLFKEAINLIFQAVPSTVDFAALKLDISGNQKIVSYHDLHIWALSTTENALSVHVVVNKNEFTSDLVQYLTDMFNSKYDIKHTTIQLEISDGQEPCVKNC